MKDREFAMWLVKQWREGCDPHLCFVESKKFIDPFRSMTIAMKLREVYVDQVKLVGRNNTSPEKCIEMMKFEDE